YEISPTLKLLFSAEEVAARVRQAADLANVPAFANPTLTDHADWAFITVWFFGLYGMGRFIILWKKLSEKMIVSLGSLIIGALGLFLLFQTADHGAELVFRHGIGVVAAEDARKALAEIQAEEEALAKSGLAESANGSWKWTPGEGAEIVLRRKFNWIIGQPEDLKTVIEEDAANGQVLVLASQNKNILFTGGNSLKSVQVDARVNLDGFNGIFRIVHHVQDDLNYDFVGLENGKMVLGRFKKGKMVVEDKDSVQPTGWITLRAVGDGNHFRGYLNERLITHGHGDELPPGPVGLFIRGSGKILLDKFEVLSLR
ncbi:MAG: hypothetical protein ACE5GL_02160, partial [Calditrichia bacterium]